MAGATTTIIQEEPSKFYYNFLPKSITIAIFLLILPLFPSQPPQFIHQTILTRNWELLHLLFAGIAISYGLFSRRNDDGTHKENKFDTAQSYLSRFLHVSSSVFEDDDDDDDDDSDHPTPSWDETKIQTWSSGHQYQKVLESSRRTCDEKPLLLPVRSLKSCANDDDSSVSRRFLCSEEDNLALPSPIPWRSESNSKVLLEPRSLVKSQTLDSYGSNSMSFSGSESVAKNAEDVMEKKKKKKSLKIKKPYPPPPPPPPPNPMLFKSISMKPRTGTSFVHQGASFDKGIILNRSFTKGDSLMEESEDDEDEDDDDGEEEEEEERSRSGNGNGGGDVDKKADEFIAKFREQIRLQRIDSIKRSAIRITRNSSRKTVRPV
ncbi:zinc finger CCCH domain-containing protein 18-like [Senna tora]|uniref:Zinc finger CCCH domain-containing protein 18-like n=1 Tax=Senna tora TaxID=362788 RepID=A0A834SUD5_9FABA|nr:zinc finger CCCH domain-containing protein 18-like [Senna tora]